jgi:hypothetical protein
MVAPQGDILGGVGRRMGELLPFATATLWQGDIMGDRECGEGETP